MQPHQERVVNEKKELDNKLSKLKVFITENPTFTTLDGREQDRLHLQFNVMKEYSEILEQRIQAFTPST